MGTMERHAQGLFTARMVENVSRFMPFLGARWPTSCQTSQARAWALTHLRDKAAHSRQHGPPRVKQLRLMIPERTGHRVAAPGAHAAHWLLHWSG